MLKPITFSVEGESGPVTVTASGPDYLAYEERFNLSVLSALGERRYSAWLFLVWHAMHRQGLTEKDWAAFVVETPMFEPGEPEEIVPLES
jgi:hypothetical protein